MHVGARPVWHRVLLQLICISLLLVSQQAALTHAVWHATERLHGHGVAGGAHDSHDAGHHDADTARALCSLDMVYGEVLGAICGRTARAAAVAQAPDHVGWLVHRRVAVERVRAVSRGPPDFS